MKSLVLILAIASPILAKPGIFDFTNDCLKAQFNNPNSCAIIYDDDGCEGWAHPINTGYSELGFSRRNDAESVVVRAGCVFTGYDHSDSNVNNRGRSFRVSAQNSRTNVYKDLNGRSELEERISSVECSCPGNVGNTGGFGGSGNGNNRPGFGSGGRPDYGNSNQWSGNSGPNCNGITMNPGTDCIVYDEGDCRVDDWSSPLTFRAGQSKSFSTLESWTNIKYKNDIESVSVRRGCALQVFADSNFSDDNYTFRAPRTQDLHMTLERDPITRSLKNDIESLKCFC